MTVTGKPLFSNRQLANLTLLLPADKGNMSPQRLDAKRTQTQESDTSDNKVPQPVLKAIETVMCKVKEKRHDLISELFLELVLTIKIRDNPSNYIETRDDTMPPQILPRC
jgi:hypothetical protein